MKEKLRDTQIYDKLVNNAERVRNGSSDRNIIIKNYYYTKIRLISARHKLAVMASKGNITTHKNTPIIKNKRIPHLQSNKFCPHLKHS